MKSCPRLSRKALSKGLMKISLIIFILSLVGFFVFNYVLPAFAGTHTSSVSVDPSWAKCSDTITFIVNVTHTSGDPINEIRIYNNTVPHTNFQCGAAPSGWELADKTGIPYLSYCLYTAQTLEDMLNYSSLILNFTAHLTTESNYSWKIITYDLEGRSYPNNPPITVDCTPPKTTKTYDGPNKPEIYELPPLVNVHYIAPKTKIVLTPVDSEPHPSGVAETWYIIKVPCDPKFEECLQPEWIGMIDHNIYHDYGTCVANNQGENCTETWWKIKRELTSNWTRYESPFVIPQESIHKICFYSVDKVGNREGIKCQVVIVDDTPPIAYKEVGEPKVKIYDVCGNGIGWSEPGPAGGDPHCITVDCCSWYQEAHIHDLGQILPSAYVYMEYTPGFSDRCQDTARFYYSINGTTWTQFYSEPVTSVWLSSWKTYNTTQLVPDMFRYIMITINDTPCFNDFSKVEYGYFVTNETQINITCIDQPPHPVNQEKVWWRISLDGVWGGWNSAPSPIVVNFKEDSHHDLEYYCEDYLGNKGKHHAQYYKVDSTPPNITKTVGEPKYWNGTNWFIDTSTKICLEANDGEHGIGVDDIQYRYRVNSGNWTDWFVYNGCFNFPEYSIHEMEYYANDTLGNKEIHSQTLIVDNTPPNTTKIYGEPYYTDGYKEWINSSTPIYLYAEDQEHHPSGVNETWYRIWLFNETIKDWTPKIDWELYWYQDGPEPKPFVIPQESLHKICYFSIDKLGNIEEEKCQEVIVDNTSPNTIKTISDPYYKDEDGNEWITQNTTITLECEDQEPHPVNHEQIYYRYYVNNGLKVNWTKYTEPIKFQEDSNHILEYYCADALGNEEEHHTQTYIVDTKPPIIEKIVGEPKYACIRFPIGDCWWITSKTEITLNAWDGDTHAVGLDYCEYRYYRDGELIKDWTKFIPPTIITLPESNHTLEYHCFDKLGNKAEGREILIVDNTPPNTTKIYGEPYYTDGYKEWINSSTPIYLYAEDQEHHPSGVNETWYKDVIVPDKYCENPEKYCYPVEDGNWTLYWKQGDPKPSPIYKEEESCHIIEYYSIDKVGNKEDLKWQCVYIDNTPPIINKTIGEPKVECEEGEECDYWVNQSTPIYLECEDQEPHPVNHETTWWGYYWNDTWYGWYNYSETGPIRFTEDSIHELRYYCEDALGNTNGIHRQIYIVDSTPPTINKTVGEPKFWNGTYWFVNSSTAFKLECVDEGIHAVNNVTLYCRYKVDEGEWIELKDCTEFTYPEDSVHTLEYSCKDALGNAASGSEIDIVDNFPPEITPIFPKPDEIVYQDYFYIRANVTDLKCGVEDIITKIDEEETDYLYNKETGELCFPAEYRAYWCGYDPYPYWRCRYRWECQERFFAKGEHQISINTTDCLGQNNYLYYTFEVRNEYCDIELKKPWNLISLPLIPENSSIEAVLSNITDYKTKVKAVWYYNASTGEWLGYSPGAPSDLLNMKDGFGYWVKMAFPVKEFCVKGVDFEIPGPPPEYPVYKGWNMIGFKSTESMEPTDYLASIAQKWTNLMEYDPEYGFKTTCILRSEWWFPYYDCHNDMYPGYGYWLYAIEDGKIAPPAPYS